MTWLLTILVVLACLLGGAEPQPAPEPERPNILLITIETLRRDHCSLYGYERDTTPFLRELANEGTIYTRAYSASSWTRPSIASVMTGLRPSQHRTNARSDRLPEEHFTLAERLQAAGYATGGFMANHILQPPTYGYDQGHTQWADTADDTAMPLVEKVCTWIVGQREPWYVHMHPMDPHGPYDAPSPYGGCWAGCATPAFAELRPQPGRHPEPTKTLTDQDWPYIEACYDEEIAYTDAALGRLFHWLRATDRWEQTLVIVTADHGEALGEGGRWGHGYMLSEEQVAVPLITKWPDGRHAGETVAAPAYGPDVFATILAATGRHVPSRCEGRPLDQLVPDRTLTLEYVARTCQIGRQTGRDSDAAAFVTAAAYCPATWPRRPGALPPHVTPDLRAALALVHQTPMSGVRASPDDETVEALRDLGYL